MRIRDHSVCVVALVAASFFTGCASSRAPSGWLPDAGDVGSDPWGAWIEIDWVPDDNLKHMVRGELIAVSPDTVYAMGATYLHAVALDDIEKAVVEVFDPELGGLKGAVVVGTLSTGSHGFYLVFSAPGWMLLGGLVVAARAHEPIVRFPGTSHERLADYARFPQGLPPGIDRATLKPKPWTDKPGSSSRR